MSRGCSIEVEWKNREEEFRNELEEAELTSQDTVLEVDEMRFGLHRQLRWVWAQRGVKIVQPRQFEFDYRYLTLAVDPRTEDIQWDWMDTMKASDFLVLCT
jgi:hypothetical protein